MRRKPFFLECIKLGKAIYMRNNENRKPSVKRKPLPFRSRDRIDNLIFKPEEGEDKSLQVAISTSLDAPLAIHFPHLSGVQRQIWRSYVLVDC